MIEKEKRDAPSIKTESPLVKKIGATAARKLKSKRSPEHGIWLGLGMMGLVGWSVVLPTLLGASLGVWLDAKYSDNRSWTLTLLIGGLALGCLNAWHWVNKEDRAIREDNSND